MKEITFSKNQYQPNQPVQQREDGEGGAILIKVRHITDWYCFRSDLCLSDGVRSKYVAVSPSCMPSLHIECIIPEGYRHTVMQVDAVVKDSPGSMM